MACLFLVQYKCFLYLSWVNNYKFRASRGHTISLLVISPLALPIYNRQHLSQIAKATESAAYYFL